LRDFASFVGIDDINWVCDKLNWINGLNIFLRSKKWVIYKNI
jgi:hypothetical protein